MKQLGSKVAEVSVTSDRFFFEGRFPVCRRVIMGCIFGPGVGCGIIGGWERIGGGLRDSSGSCTVRGM